MVEHTFLVSHLAGFSMPGNEGAGKLHNFFEQENSSQNPQSHIGPILNNNPRVGTQGQNGLPLNSNSKNSTHFLDSERENGRQLSQMPFGTLNQFGLKPGFDKRQHRNQQLGLNGFMHDLQGSQTRFNQAKFLEDHMVSDTHSSLLGGLANFESQQGNAPEYGSGHIRNSERSEVAKVPVNFDFLGNQQQLMRSQHLGMSPYSRQHPGFGDTQLWQQHLMYKQRQELQRQLQLQQLDQGARLQNSHSQLSVAKKQAGIDQLPVLLDGVPVPMNDTSMYACPNNFMGGESKALLNSQIGISGNVNWQQCSGSPAVQDYSNEVMFPNDQGQAMRSLGFGGQQLDLSLNGIPVSSTRISSNQYSHGQGMSADCTDVMTKTSIQSAPSNSFQSDHHIRQNGCLDDCISADTHSFQGKSLRGNASVQNLSAGLMSGDFQQVNHLQENDLPQEFQDRKEHADWSHNLQEKAEAHVGPSCVVASLDPTEEKLLFGTGDDDTWDATFGSWSALVEDAVRGSSHDSGPQDEWNHSSFRKSEPATGNHSDVFHDSGKQQSTLLTSKPSPLFSGVESSTNLRIAPNFQHSSIKSAYEQNDRVLTNASQESFQQLFKEAKIKQFDPSHKQKQFVEGDLQAHMQINDVRSSEMDFNSRNTQGVWTHQQNMPFFNASGQLSDKQNDWNANESLACSGDDTLKVHGNDNTKQFTQRNDTKRTMYVERDYNGIMGNIGRNRVSPSELEPESDTGSPQIQAKDACMVHFDSVMNSNASEATHKMNQQVLNRHQVDFGKQVAFNSFSITKEDENMGKSPHQLSRGQQTWHSSLNRTEKGAGETSDNKQEHPKVASNEDCTSNQHTDNGDSERENSLSTGSGPHPSISVGENSSGQAGRQMAPRRFQYHPMGNLGPKVEPADSPSHTSYSQGTPHSVIGGFENQDQGYVRHAQFAGHAVSNNGVGMGKNVLMALLHSLGQYIDLQRNIKEAEEIQSRVTIPTHNSTASASFGGSTSQFSQNNRIGQTSQNMLQLLHKVNQSRRNKNASRLGFSDHNTPSETPETAAFGGSTSRPQHNQLSSSQGFGLQLAPPSQWQQIPNHVLLSQTSLHNSNTRQVDLESGDRDQAKSPSAASVQSLPLPHEASPSTLGNSFAVTTSDLSYKREKLQQQQLQQQQYISVAPGRELMDPSVDQSCRSPGVNAHVNHAPLLRHAHDSHDRAVTDKFDQASLPNMTGRVPPFRIASYADNRLPASQFYSPDTGPSQPMGAGFYHPRSSGQQLPQPLATSGMSQQAGFSTMSHNVGENVSGFQPHNYTPNVLQSMTMSKSDRCTNSWAIQKVVDRSHNGVSASTDIATCSINSQQFIKDNSSQQVSSERVDATLKKDGASQGQGSMPKHHIDGKYSISISSFKQLHQQDTSEGKYEQDSSPNSQIEQTPLPNVISSGCGIGLYRHPPEPSDAQLQSYSLLQKMQATRGADSDSSKRVGNKPKGLGLGSDASHMDGKAAQRFTYGQNTVFRLPVEGELAATSLSSLPPDVKMLSFSSRENEEICAFSELAGRGVSSQDIYNSGQHDRQNHTLPLSISSTSNYKGGSNCQISPQMNPSWFERYGTYNKGQILDMYDGQRSTKASTQQYFFPNVSESGDYNIVVDKKTDTDLAVSLRRSTSSTTIAADESSSPHLLSDSMDPNTVMRSKKRKGATSEFFPWHKKVSHGSQRLQSISMAVLDWAQATNRLIEKVEDEAEMIEDSLSMSQSRRRLIVTTQLIQQLLPSVPAAVLAGEVTSAYESVTYFVAKAALGDACSLIPYLRSNYRVHLDSKNMMSEKLKSSEEVGDHILSKVVEDLIGRSKKLEVDFSRFETRGYIVDIRVDCQELERFSIINRLGKFHGRSQADGLESSAAFGTAPRRTFPQRYVTAIPMPGNLPEGALCLSL